MSNLCSIHTVTQGSRKYMKKRKMNSNLMMKITSNAELSILIHKIALVVMTISEKAMTKRM
jgi:hypothetical protein